MLIAFLFVLAQLQFKLIPLQGGSFIIDYFPVKLNPWDFVLVGSTVIVIGLLASYMPARKAADQQFIAKED
jgi:lipoprotein-releasing system permease protein